MMHPTDLAKKINNFSILLIEEGLAIDYRLAVVSQIRRRNRVSWNPPEDFELSSIPSATILGYRQMLDNSCFSSILSDGALLQISYDMDAGNIAGHRLGFVPCPIDINADDLVQNSLSDLVRLFDPLRCEDAIKLRPAIRFDYDPDNSAVGHPASHVHIGADSCRMPVVRPLSIRQFVSFVFRHFYPDATISRTVIDAMPEFSCDRCIASDDTKIPHIEFVLPA